MRGHGIIVVVSVALLLGGCAAEEPSGLLTYPLPEDWVADAGLKVGTLAFVDDCLRFEDGAIPVFPDKLTTWDGTVLTFAGEEYRLGDEMKVAGGSPVDGATVSVPIPESCGDGPIVVVGPPPRS
ncbi:hypothetical protein [Agromyces subbeticus]|uniref:hypothetical protein n=1 Tax=Agromyces subbeticus TaxID=293890 RepID=UPI0003B6FC68|nr:hypothetical protein [Agromyces subbeticus]